MDLVVMQDKGIKNVEIISAEEDEYLWSFAYLIFESELILLKWINEEFSKFAIKKDKKIDVKLWTGKGKGFKQLLEEFKEINKHRKIKTYKKPIFRFDASNKWLKNMTESMNLMKGTHLLRKMSLVYLISVFEEYLQKILTFTFRKKPETLRTSQKTLSVEEIIKFKDLDSIREAIIEKEILIVNEDIEKVREYIKKKFGIDISQIEKKQPKQLENYAQRVLSLEKCNAFNWKDFKERFYRRNIIIHNLGVPNKKYRQKTGYQGKNKALEVSTDYLNESLNLFCQISMNMGLAFEEKIQKKL